MDDVIGLRVQRVLTFLAKVNGNQGVYWPTDYSLDPPMAKVLSPGNRVITVHITTEGFMVRINGQRRLFHDIGYQRGPKGRHPVNMIELRSIIEGVFPREYYNPDFIPDPKEL